MLYNTSSPRSIAHTFSKEIPRKTNLGWEAMERGRNAEVIRGVGGIVRISTLSERKVKYRATTHAERAH